VEAPTPNEADDFEAERALWSAIRAIQEAKGFDLEDLLTAFATSERSRLSEEGAGRDLGTLCERGCHPWILAGLLTILHRQEQLKEFWAPVLGTVEERDASLRVLDNAAATVERLFGGLVAADDSPQFSRIGRL
jgi:hypothetical protein